MAARDDAAARAQQRTALISVGAAVFLVAIKLVTGLITGSLGLIAEAAHSGTDFVAALLTLFAIRVAVRPADQAHHYGHGKAEHLAALGESTFLMVVSVFLGVQAIERLSSSSTHQVDATWWAFVVMGIVIAVDASRAVISLRASRRHHSAALASNALHFGSDLAGSVAVLVGLVLVASGEPNGDPIAALLVAVLVILAAARLAWGSSQVLMDHASAEAERAIDRALGRLDEPVDVRRVRIRHAGARAFVDLVVAVRPDAALTQAHTVADKIEDAVRAELPEADVLVHVEPGESEGDLRERATIAALTIPDVREVHNVRVMYLDGGYELSLHVKLPRELSLAQAHDSVERLEDAIRTALPEVRTVHAHIEPLSQTDYASRPAREEVAGARDAIEDVVRRYTGQSATAVRFRDGDRGRVALVTVLLPPDQPLPSAHRRAGDIEEAVRERCPELAEVIIHTEPAPSASGAHG
jgi:cation diffusion facilitator family transporter